MIPQEILIAILRTIIAFTLLLVLTRFMGKKALSQMTFFDFAVTITMGSVAANLALSYSHALPSAITILIVFALLAILIDYLHIKSHIVDKVVQSEPVIIV